MNKRLFVRVLLACAALACVVISASAQAGGGSLYLPLVLRASPSPILAGCAVFPGDNIWNRRVDDLPVDSRSNAYINSIGPTTRLHADFGSIYGIPYTDAPAGQAPVAVTFDYDDESDPGPYPIPPDAPVEDGSDYHVLVVQRDTCRLYEMWNARKQANGTWLAGSGAVFDLNSNALRPAGWTSADAAGLPILPGLVRYDEVKAGEIRHAIRFTASSTQQKYVWPARHYASDITDANVPPMGQRFRLKAGVDLSGYPADIQVIFRAFQQYGIILADNGSNWYITGAPDPLWDDDMLVSTFRSLHGSDFEAVDTSGLVVDPNSGQSK